MTKRTRLFLLIASGVLAAGLGTGLLASYMGLQTLTLIGSVGPDELAYVPSDAALVGFADVRAVMNSEFRQKLRELHPDGSGDDDLLARTGIDIENDIDHVVAASLAGQQGQRPLVIARGRFDEVRIESLIRESGGSAEDYGGERILSMPESSGESMALSFTEPGIVVVGQLSSVRLAIDTKAGDANVTDNTELMALVRDVEDGTAWAVGRFDAIASGGRIPPAVVEQLPAINLFSASGRINGGLQATVRAEARDDAAAQNLRDVIRGFVALARLQVGTNEQLLALLNSVQLAGDGSTVALSVTIPADALSLIAPRREQASAGF